MILGSAGKLVKTVFCSFANSVLIGIVKFGYDLLGIEFLKKRKNAFLTVLLAFKVDDFPFRVFALARQGELEIAGWGVILF